MSHEEEWDVPCHCVCHVRPGVLHVTPCCHAPSFTALEEGLVEDAERQREITKEWSVTDGDGLDTGRLPNCS